MFSIEPKAATVPDLATARAWLLLLSVLLRCSSADPQTSVPFDISYSATRTRRALVPGTGATRTGRAGLPHRGRLRARVRPSPPTVTATGVVREVVTLTYASPSALRQWSATGVFDLDVIVQVRDAPGVNAPDVTITASDGELSTLLRGHLP